MNQLTKFFFNGVIIYTLFFPIVINAQLESVVASSGLQVSEQYSVNATIGQVFVHQLHSEVYQLSEGFQQFHNLGVTHESKNYNSVKIFPNPSSDRLEISSSTELKNLNVLDVNGRVVLFKTVMKDYDHQLDVSRLVPGMYILEIQFLDNTKTNQQFVKN